MGTVLSTRPLDGSVIWVPFPPGLHDSVESFHCIYHQNISAVDTEENCVKHKGGEKRVGKEWMKQKTLRKKHCLCNQA